MVTMAMSTPLRETMPPEAANSAGVESQWFI